MSKEKLGETITVASGKLGGKLAGAGVGSLAAAGTINIATAASTASAVAWFGGPAAVSGSALGLMSTTPAWWAVLATNPITMPVAAAAAGGAILGATAGYKLFKKVFG